MTDQGGAVATLKHGAVGGDVATMIVCRRSSYGQFGLDGGRDVEPALLFRPTLVGVPKMPVAKVPSLQAGEPETIKPQVGTAAGSTL
jgi:hypothetical protein